MEEVQSAAQAGYHLSNYNLFKNIPNENLIACVNLMKGTYSELDPKDLLNIHNLNQIKADDKNLQFFLNQGIVVNYDEKELLKSMALRINSNMNVLKITIAVTMSCNFNCPYCFEFHKSGKMTLETQKDIVSFVKKSLEISKAKRLDMTWYGGEPLLVPDIIESLSNEILPYLKENNIEYVTNIITNGYYFTQENADMLKRVKVNNCQITLDGLEKNHNLTRSLKNGNPTFDVIINNLQNTKFHGTINVRHNIHENNKQDAEELEKLIRRIAEESGNNINYYSAVVVNNPAEQRKNQVNFLNGEGNAKIQMDKEVRNFLSARCYFCGAQAFWSFCIDNEGLLYKCWEDVGKTELSFGNIKKWNPYNPFYSCDNMDVLIKYLTSMGITGDEECYNCIWLPICAGGCAGKRIFHNIRCFPSNYLDYDVDYFIDMIAKYIKNKNKSNKEKFKNLL